MDMSNFNVKFHYEIPRRNIIPGNIRVADPRRSYRTAMRECLTRTNRKWLGRKTASSRKHATKYLWFRWLAKKR